MLKDLFRTDLFKLLPVACLAFLVTRQPIWWEIKATPADISACLHSLCDVCCCMARSTCCNHHEPENGPGADQAASTNHRSLQNRRAGPLYIYILYLQNCCDNMALKMRIATLLMDMFKTTPAFMFVRVKPHQAHRRLMFLECWWTKLDIMKRFCHPNEGVAKSRVYMSEVSTPFWHLRWLMLPSSGQRLPPLCPASNVWSEERGVRAATPRATDEFRWMGDPGRCTKPKKYLPYGWCINQESTQISTVRANRGYLFLWPETGPVTWGTHLEYLN